MPSLKLYAPKAIEAAAAGPTRRRWLQQVGATLLTGAAAASTAQPLPKPGPGGFTELRWDDLVPKGWDPMKGLRDQGITNPGSLMDGDPKTQALMNQMRELWDNAPTEPSLDGTRVKLPGYLVPLEESAAGHTEFLLVPTAGACVHTPPPPTNQIVYATMTTGRAAKVEQVFSVWVSGRLEIASTDSPYGQAGFKLGAVKVERRG